MTATATDIHKRLQMKIRQMRRGMKAIAARGGGGMILVFDNSDMRDGIYGAICRKLNTAGYNYIEAAHPREVRLQVLWDVPN